MLYPSNLGGFINKQSVQSKGNYPSFYQKQIDNFKKCLNKDLNQNNYNAYTNLPNISNESKLSNTNNYNPTHVYEKGLGIKKGKNTKKYEQNLDSYNSIIYAERSSGFSSNQNCKYGKNLNKSVSPKKRGLNNQRTEGSSENFSLSFIAAAQPQSGVTSSSASLKNFYSNRTSSKINKHKNNISSIMKGKIFKLI